VHLAYFSAVIVGKRMGDSGIFAPAEIYLILEIPIASYGIETPVSMMTNNGQ
jgi:hypothetical protein